MLEKIKRFLTFKNISVLLLLVFSFVVRIFRAGELLAFHYDQGRDALVIWDLINKGEFFLIGPTTGIAGIFRGPFYYYLIAPFYWLGGGNPILPEVFLILTSVFALILLFFLAKKIGGTLAGIIALILGGFSFEIVYASRWLSNPTPMLILSMILIWMMFLVYEGKKWAWMVISFVLGLSLFHFGSSGEVFYFPVVAIFAIWKFFFSKGKTKNIPSLKTILISVGLFVFTVLPLILFNWKHGGILADNIKGFLVTGESFSLPTWRFVVGRLGLVLNYFSGLLFHSPYDKEWVFLGGFGILVLYYLSRLIKNARFNIVALTLAMPILGLIFFQGNYGNLYGYYLTGYYLIFILFVAVCLSFIFKSSWVGKVLVGVFLFYFLSHNYTNLKSYLTTSGRETDAIVLVNQKEAIDWIYKDVGEREFNVDCYVPPVISYSYDYLFKWLGTTMYQKLPLSSQTSLLYTLYEVDPPHPERLQAWLDRQKGIGKVIKEEKFGGITVEVRERITKK